MRADKCPHWFREGRGRQGEREESPETDYNDGEMERVELTGNKTSAINWGNWSYYELRINKSLVLTLLLYPYVLVRYNIMLIFHLLKLHNHCTVKILFVGIHC